MSSKYSQASTQTIKTQEPPTNATTAYPFSPSKCSSRTSPPSSPWPRPWPSPTRCPSRPRSPSLRSVKAQDAAVPLGMSTILSERQTKVIHNVEFSSQLADPSFFSNPQLCRRERRDPHLLRPGSSRNRRLRQHLPLDRLLHHRGSRHGLWRIQHF